MRGGHEMSTDSIEKAVLTKAALALFDEAYFGPTGKGTWFIDNEPKSGFLGSLEACGAAEASRRLNAGDPLTLASHVGHLRYALSLANRALRGENPYADADWAASWDARVVGEPEWKLLVAGLRKETEDFREALAGGRAWADEEFLTGTLGLIAHGAWHLGAIRQGLGLVKAPAAN
jgi:hypothetical protein